MANLYWSEEELKHISPAEFVRASMAVPFFFEPFQKQINTNESSVKYAWKYWMNTKPEDINPAGVFIDGGSISNFPIDLFHADEVSILECLFLEFSSRMILIFFLKEGKPVKKFSKHPSAMPEI